MFTVASINSARTCRGHLSLQGTGSLEELTPEDRERLERHPVGGRWEWRGLRLTAWGSALRVLTVLPCVVCSDIDD